MKAFQFIVVASSAIMAVAAPTYGTPTDPDCEDPSPTPVPYSGGGHGGAGGGGANSGNICGNGQQLHCCNGGSSDDTNLAGGKCAPLLGGGTCSNSNVYCCNTTQEGLLINIDLSCSPADLGGLDLTSLLGGLTGLL